MTHSTHNKVVFKVTKNFKGIEKQQAMKAHFNNIKNSNDYIQKPYLQLNICKHGKVNCGECYQDELERKCDECRDNNCSGCQFCQCTTKYCKGCYKCEDEIKNNSLERMKAVWKAQNDMTFLNVQKLKDLSDQHLDTIWTSYCGENSPMTELTNKFNCPDFSLE